MAGPSGYGQDTAGHGTAHMANPDDIIPRDIRFGILGNAQRHWLEDDIIKTVLIDGLSVFLPEGERFFIRSLKHYAAKMPDRQMAAEINGYAVQEAFHTREHEEYNRAMMSLGYDVEAMEKPIRFGFEVVKNPLHRLAITCAIEHMTATLSTLTLRHPDLLDKAAPAYRRLWMWHALEELEHKAVALDVLQAATPEMSRWQRYMLRVLGMNGTLLPFLVIFLRNVPIYARADGVKTGLRFWLRFIWVTLGYPGYWRRCLPNVLRYYLPGFDPRNSDDAELMRKGREWLANDMPPGSGAAPAGKAG
ncbi:metal-dependent hydrolase [Azorhizobium doebereinerae]|uniref:metal-dependent hydrolase n=1 Tax=Azorhizobium doebereinerae TaxID=281091 RepID=UPI001AEBE776|nr:metal-dependent hydrolase [Azorhizobium doebereinerae]